MMTTRTIVAALAGGVVSFLLGWLVYGFLLMDFMDESMVDYNGLMRAENEMRIWAIAIAQFCISFLLAWLFQSMGHVRSFMSGFMAGAVIGGLVTANFDLGLWAQMNLFSYKFMLVDIPLGAAFNGIVGGVIAMIMGRSAK